METETDNGDCASGGSPDNGPKSKRRCDIVTPVKFKGRVLERCVKVTNLPPALQFMENHFCNHIEKARKRNHIAENEANAILKIFDFSKDTCSVSVEFISSEVAEKMCGISTKYMKYDLKFVQEVYLNQTMYFSKPSSPDTSTPLNSTDAFTQQMKELSPFPKAKRSLLLNVVEDIVMDNLPPLHSFAPTANSTLEVDLRVQMEEVGQIEEVGQKKDNISTIQEGANSRIKPNLSCKVQVGNLPAKFHKDHFIDFINSEVNDMMLLNEDLQPVVSASDPQESTTIVEFKTLEQAAAACLIVTQYGKSKLNFTHIPAEESSMVTTLSCQVQVGNLPDKFYKDHFLDFINSEVRQLMDLDILDEDPAVSVSDTVRNTTIVHFNSVEQAAAACLIAEKYDKKQLHFKHLPKENFLYEASGRLGTHAIEKDIVSIVNVSTLGGEDDNNNSSDAKKKIMLTSAEGDVIFLKKLVGLRILFAQKDHKAGFVSLLAECTKENIETDLQAITKRRRYFGDLFTRKKREGVAEYLHWQPLTVIFGGEDSDILKGTIYESHDIGEINLLDVNSVVASSTKFSKGTLFTNSASVALVALMKTNFDTYRCANNVDIFFDRLSDLMIEKGHYYSGPRCLSRWKEGIRLHRDEIDRRKRTGEPSFVGQGEREPWFMSEEMTAMMRTDHSVFAPLTLSAGSSNHMLNRRRIVSDEEDDCNESFSKVGKSRIPMLRQQSNRGGKNAGLFAIAASLDRRTEALKNNK